MHKTQVIFFKSIFALRLIFISLLLVQCNSTEKVDEDVLAQINGFTVTTTHFENAFKEYYYRTGQAIRPSNSTKLTILNTEFNTYVLATHAKDLGLDEHKEAFYKRGEIERKVLNEEYLNQVILSNIKVTEEELTKYFIRFNTTLRASHLYAPNLETANTLYKRLEEGETFEDLAYEVFRTPYLADNGGDIGRFTTDEMDIAFEEGAFELTVGEISKPIPTAQGYSIIKLTDKFTKPILTRTEFANKKDQIESYVYKKKRELATRQHIYDFKDGLEINEEVFDQLWDYMNENYPEAVSKNSEFLANLFSDKILAKFQDFEFTLSDFSTEYQFTTLSQINAIEGREGLKNFIIGITLRAYLFQSAKNIGIDQQRLVQESINETYYTYLAAEVIEYLKGTIENTEAELFKYYTEHKNRFFKPIEVNLSQIVVDSEKKAEEVISKFKSGVDFKSLVKEYTIFNEDLMTEGELGFKILTSYGSYAPRIAEMNIGEISEPFNYQSNQFTVYKMNDRIEGRSMSFDEARELVDAYLTSKKLKVLKERTIEDVKKKHNAIVDIEKLNQVTIQI